MYNLSDKRSGLVLLGKLKIAFSSVLPANTPEDVKAATCMRRVKLMIIHYLFEMCGSKR
jgi:hypothetical protein